MAREPRCNPRLSIPPVSVRRAPRSLARIRRLVLARDGGRLRASAGGLASTFARSGVQIRAGRDTLGLALTAWGIGAGSAVPEVAPSVAASNTVLYSHGAVVESYRNGQHGLEQSFTLRHTPLQGSGPVVLSLGLTGSLRAIHAGSQILFEGSNGATVVRYGQLHVLDAKGRQLPSHMQLGRGSIRLVIDDAREIIR